jgi:hypothetical protein
VKTTIATNQPKPTFGKLMYSGQHAYFFHKVRNFLASEDPLQEALEVAKRKGVTVIGFEVIGPGNPMMMATVEDEDGRTTQKWVPAKVKEVEEETPNGSKTKLVTSPTKDYERIYLVKCMAPRS